MKVNSREIYADAEDEYIMLCIMKEELDEQYRNAPRWFFLASEWSAYISKSVGIDNRLRKLKELIEYNSLVAD